MLKEDTSPPVGANLGLSGGHMTKERGARVTIEVAVLMSAVALAFGIYQGVSNLKRSQKTDNQSEAAQLTTVIVKLENIGMGITEIKSEMGNVKNEVKECRERLIKAEESLKQAHSRLEACERALKKG